MSTENTPADRINDLKKNKPFILYRSSSANETDKEEIPENLEEIAVHVIKIKNQEEISETDGPDINICKISEIYRSACYLLTAMDTAVSRKLSAYIIDSYTYLKDVFTVLLLT